MATAVRPAKQKKPRTQKRESSVVYQPKEEAVSIPIHDNVEKETHEEIRGEVKSKFENEIDTLPNGTLDPLDLATHADASDTLPPLELLPLTRTDPIEYPAAISAPPTQVHTQLLDLARPVPLQREVKPIYPAVSTLQETVQAVNIPDLLTPEMPARFSHRHQDTISHADSLAATLRPLTEMELYSFCPTPLLDTNQVYVDSFVRRASPTDLTGHPLYQLLVRFQTSRLEHLSSQHDCGEMERRAALIFSEIWSIDKKLVKGTGQCRDHNRVTRTHEFEYAQMSEQELQTLEIVSSDLRAHLTREVTVKASHCEYERLEIVSYLSHLLQSCEEFRSLTSDKPVRATDPSVLHFITETQNASLRDCLSVLFIFERRPKRDELFHRLLREWITALLSYLLRTASYSDHLFILNHILRCPPGVGAWCAPFIQFQPLLELTRLSKSGQTLHYNEGYALSPLSDHFLTMLATLLLPVKEREQFLKHLEIEANTPVIAGGGSAWVFVAEDVVEDDEDAVNKKFLVEEDLVSVFDQFPFSSLFQYLLLEGADQLISESGYSAERVSSHGMLTLVAFCSRLVELLGAGFSTFKLARYREFVKRLGRMVRYVVHMVSDHWLAYRHYREERGDSWTEAPGPSLPGQSVHSLLRIQVEVDSFLLRATKWILSSHKLGAWQFLADMPFETVSLEAVWKVFWLIHSNHLPITAEELISRGLGRVSGLKDILKDPDYREQFIDNIMRIPLSEAIFLFTTFANMARARDYSRPKDYEFIETVVLELMEVSFLNPVSRETYSRTGRDLLDTIVLKHPQVISILIQITSEGLFMMGDSSLFLFNTFSFSDWLPAPRDLQVLSSWLMRTDLGTNENSLAQLVLGRMNWGRRDDGILFLPASLHREVALAAVEACGRLIPKIPGNLGGEGTGPAKGLREVLQSYLSMMSEDQQKMLSWSWKVVLLLSLHSSEVNPPENEEDIPISTEVEGWTPHVFPLDLHHDASLVSLSHAVKTEGPLACYVALSVCMIGHETDLFCHEGVDLLQVLMDNRQFIPAMRVIKNVSPRFFEMKPDLAPPNLLKIVYQLSQADISSASLTEKWILGEGSKFNKCFCSLLHQQITERWNVEKSAGLNALKFWTATMITYPDWYRDRKLLSIVNALCELAFNKPEMEKVLVDSFFLSVQSLPRHLKKGGRMQSVVSLVTGEQAPPSLLDCFTPQEHGWFAYFAMQAEERFERESGVWKSLLTSLIADPRQSFDTAIKACGSELKLQNYPLSHLSLYRWGKLSTELPYSHPALPLCWQRFMFYYLHRPAPSGTDPQPSLGYLFFENYTYFTQLKAMRKNLQAGHQKFKELCESPADSLSEEEKEANSTLKQVFLTLGLWIDEPRLHEADLYLPALPPQYDSKRLAQLVSNQLTPWLELVNLKAIEDSVKLSCHEWTSSFEVKKSNSPVKKQPVKSIEKRIMERISHTDALSPVPPLEQVAVPFVSVLRSCLSDTQLLLTEVRKDLRCLTEYFEVSQSKARDLTQLHGTLITLVPDLYQNQPETSIVQATCKSTCSGSCQIQFRFNQARKNESIAQLIDTNIKNTETLIVEAKTQIPLDFSIACLRISATIRDLKEVYDKSNEKDKLQESARAMFYELLSSITIKSKDFATSREFYYNACQSLGFKFIASIPGEAVKLLEQIQDRLYLASFVVSLFRPELASCLDFIDMYAKINRLVSQHDSTIGATLISKFDVRTWLSKQFKGSPDIFKLTGLIFEGLGMQEVKQDDTLLLLYLSHLEEILKHDFPSVFSAVLHLLLGGSETGTLSTHSWTYFLDRLNATEKERGRIPREIVTAELSFMSKHMMEQRVTSQQTLYTLWGVYQQYIGAVITSLVEMAIESLAEQCAMENESLASETDLREIWDTLCDVYRPWLFPAKNTDGSINIPWHLSESETSAMLILKFVNCTVHIQQKLPTRKGQPNILNLFWDMYTTQLALPSTPESILERLHTGFLSLHWDLFLPSLADLLGMAELRSAKHTLVFTAGIFVKIKWDSILVTSSPYPAVQERREALALYLTISCTLLSDEYVLRQTEHGGSLFSLSEHSTQALNWGDLSVSGLESVCSWLTDNKPPSVFLFSSASATILAKLLQAASGYPSYSTDRDTQTKQTVYVRFIVDNLCKYSLLPEARDLPAKRTVSSLISLISSVSVSAMGVEFRTSAESGETQDSPSSHTTRLISELLNVLNNSAPNSTVLKTALLSIINSLSPAAGTEFITTTQILCIPALSAACRSLAAMSHMVQLVETCIETHFTGMSPPSQEEVTGTDGVMLLPRENGYGWKPICDALTLPEMSEQEYVSASLESGACLTLFSKILLDLPNCRSLEDELMRARTIAGWCAGIKPSPLVESKLILLIVQLFKLLTRQVRFGTPLADLLPVISNFVSTLAKFTEDKSSEGLLGAIGFGRKSDLSVKFRLACRILQCFASLQLPVDCNSVVHLRIVPRAPGHPKDLSPPARDTPGAVFPSKEAELYLLNLTCLSSNKVYGPLYTSVLPAISMVNDVGFCFVDCPLVFMKVVSVFYPDSRFLDLARVFN